MNPKYIYVKQSIYDISQAYDPDWVFRFPSFDYNGTLPCALECVRSMDGNIRSCKLHVNVDETSSKGSLVNRI